MADLTGSLTSSTRMLSDGSKCITLDFAQTRLISTNESEISWSLKGAGTSTQYAMSGPFEVSIDNKKVYSSSTRIKLYKGTAIASGKITVKHNDDGSKQLPISISAAIYEYAVNVKGSQTFTLVSNPRESTVTASDTEIGKVCNISISKAVNSYTSTISYKLYKDGNRGSVLASGPIGDPKTAQTSIPWEIPTDFFALLWNTPTGYCDILCDTYNGNTKIGSTKSTSIRITMDNSINPQISECIALNNDTTTNTITGENGFIVGQGYISVKCSAVANKSAKISSITVLNDTKLYAIENGVTSQIPNPIGSDFVFKVTDSRGISVEQTVKLVACDYTTPSISIEQLKMELDPNDTTKGLITVSVAGNGYSGTIGSTQNNTTIEFKITDESDQSKIVENTKPLEWTMEVNGAYHFYEAKDIVFSVDKPDSTYKIVATVKDLVNTEGINSTELAVSRLPVYDYNKHDFNFNVPIYYKDKPFIDVQYPAGGENSAYPYARYQWRYSVIQDEYIELHGKVYIPYLSFTTNVGNMWTPNTAIKIPLPINLEIYDEDYPYVITAQIHPGTIDSGRMLMTASSCVDYDYNFTFDPPTESNGFGQLAIINCISPTKIDAASLDDTECYLHIHISGIRELPWFDGEYEDE